jgi:molybdate transport system substrate-binding protein
VSRPTGRRGLLATLARGAPVAGCGGDDDSGDTTITVLAASSLTETFTELADRFEHDHDGTHVKLVFGSSADLAQQAAGGAPADVLATADTATMDSAADALDGDPEVFASNTMVLVTPADNPAGIEGFDDLGHGGVTYVVCADTAPCGKVAAALLADNGVTTHPASLEVDVKAVLAKVTSGEADAGIVYATDAVAAGDAVTSFPIPHAEDEPTTYPIAVLRQSGDAGLADRFVELVTTGEGQQVLADAGFGPGAEQ